MPRFFVETVLGDSTALYGENALHVSKSLRMRAGEELTLCDENGMDYLCVITQLTADSVQLSVLQSKRNSAELPCKVSLYQALPKADKLEYIVQKAVELGVYDITPVLTARCISRPDIKSMQSRLERLNKIALEAAKQSGRGIVPRVNPMVSFGQAIAAMQNTELAMFCYEGGGESISAIVQNGEAKSVSVMIGSEGGFEPAEAQLAKDAKIALATLGGRILRTETAPLYALSVLSFIFENR